MSLILIEFTKGIKVDIEVDIGILEHTWLALIWLILSLRNLHIEIFEIFFEIFSFIQECFLQIQLKGWKILMKGRRSVPSGRKSRLVGVLLKKTDLVIGLSEIEDGFICGFGKD